MSMFRRKTRSRSAFGEVLAEVVREAPATLRRDRLHVAASATGMERLFMAGLCVASVSFCAFAVNTSLRDPDYFSRKLISSIQRDEIDPIETGSVAGPVSALPTETIQRARPLSAGDYQIVMIFEGEAFVATTDELLRVKVGSVLPGLGTVREIRPDADGGVIVADGATLETVPPK